MLLAAVTQTADEGFRIHDILRAVSGALEVPVIVLLVLFLLAAAALVGWLIAESCTERRHLKLTLPTLMETLRTASDREAAVEESGLLRRQKDALLELLRHPDFTDATREALAILKPHVKDVMALSTEACAICEHCAYPGAPCRHPELMFPCVESHGIIVTALAEKEGIDFYGGNLVTWFSLLLFRE